MRPGAGEIEAGHRSLVAAEPDRRSQRAEPLGERVDVVDVAVDRVEAVLELRRRVDLAADLEALDPLVVVGTLGEDLVAELLADVLPRLERLHRDDPGPEPERVLALGRLRRVRGRGREADERDRVGPAAPDDRVPGVDVVLVGVPADDRIAQVEAVVAPGVVLRQVELAREGDVDPQRGGLGQRGRDPLGARRETVGQQALREQAGQSRLRAAAREHDVRGQLVAVGEPHAGDAATRDGELVDLGREADLPAVVDEAGLERLAERAGAADEAARARPHAEGDVDQRPAGALLGHPREAGHLGERSPDEVRLEALLDHLRVRAEEEVGHGHQLAAVLGGVPDHRPQRLRRRTGRMAEHVGHRQVDQGVELLGELEPCGRVLAREVAELFGGLLRVGPDRERGAVGIEVDVVSIDRDLPEAVAPELKVGLDRRRAEERGLDRALVDHVIGGARGSSGSCTSSRRRWATLRPR